MKAVVAERGQITIPKALRDKLGLKGGTQVNIEAENGGLIITKVISDDQFERMRGCLKLGKTTDEIMEELRGPI